MADPVARPGDGLRRAAEFDENGNCLAPLACPTAATAFSILCDYGLMGQSRK
ncbi:MAG: hypothetical protein RIB49_05285 [Rhodospirillales bacterium]